MRLSLWMTALTLIWIVTGCSSEGPPQYLSSGDPNPNPKPSSAAEMPVSLPSPAPLPAGPQHEPVKTIKLAESNGKPELALIVTHDTDVSLTLFVGVKASDLDNRSAISSVQWRLISEKSVLIGWQVFSDRVAPVTYPGELNITGFNGDLAKVLQAINLMRGTVVEFSVNQPISSTPTVTHRLDLGAYCLTAPGHFADLTESTTGCLRR